MAIHDYVISNANGASVRQDLNDALAAIVSNNSNATAPTTTYAYQWWADTTNQVMKLRNAANTDWITLYQLDGEYTNITLEAGTNSAPSLRFVSDTNTGIYSPGADQVAITTGGTARLYVGSTGSVGVGTTAPNCLLEVKGGSAITTLTNSYSNCGILHQYSSSSLLAIGNDGTSPVLQGVNATTNTAKNILLNPLGGSVGIGTTSPQNQLHLVGSAATNYIRLDNSSGARTYLAVESGGSVIYSQNSAGSDAPLTFTTGSTPRATIDASGRFLVGTFSNDSNSKLVVQGNSSDSTTTGVLGLRYGSTRPTTTDVAIGVIRFESLSNTSSNYRYAQIVCSTDGTSSSDTDIPGRLSFETTADGASSPTERMRITSGGYFKASNNASYFGSTLTYHEFAQSLANDGTLIARNSNNSLSVGIYYAVAARAANSAYSFFFGASSDQTDNEFNLRGDGNGYCDGSWIGGGADYAEYFEWSDSNPDEEDRRGISVVLDGDKIREAQAGEDPIGVISGNPSVVGDAAWNKWNGKYLRDEFGTYIQEDYEVVNDEGETVVEQRRMLNPAYDPDQEYIPREQRPEWDCVGLMGKLRIRKGQITGSRWIKMRDVSDAVEEWLVR